jgi:hypothetical protein
MTGWRMTAGSLEPPYALGLPSFFPARQHQRAPPGAAAGASLASQSGRGDDVFDLARKIGSHRLYFLQSHQRQDCEEDAANPCQETK